MIFFFANYTGLLELGSNVEGNGPYMPKILIMNKERGLRMFCYETLFLKYN